jgi:formamidopyrimidine-DNA glycosylase
MPELPDVEGFRRALAAVLPGRHVRAVHVSDAGVLRNSTPAGLGRALAGCRFATPRRHGKWLLLPTDGPTLLVHSGMTGRPYYTADGTQPARFDRLVVELDRGELHYADQRKLRGVWLAHDDRAVAAVIGRQGPDALDLDLRGFVELLRGRRGAVKATLMDQAVLAGLGNLLTDEICWQACVHPGTRIADLDEQTVRRLHATMRRVLRTSVRYGCVPGLRGWLTSVRDEPEAHCPRCGSALARGRSGGRATRWCPRCQPPP